LGAVGEGVAPRCEGLPGVYSTIWCLCYKTNKLENFGEEGGHWAEPNRPGKRGNTGASRDGLAAAEVVDPECGNGVAAETAWPQRRQSSGAWSHGLGLVLIRSSPYTLACTAKSASGTA
jgi:hypothetical protein